MLPAVSADKRCQSGFKETRTLPGFPGAHKAPGSIPTSSTSKLVSGRVRFPRTKQATATQQAQLSGRERRPRQAPAKHSSRASGKPDCSSLTITIARLATNASSRTLAQRQRGPVRDERNTRIIKGRQQSRIAQRSAGPQVKFCARCRGRRSPAGGGALWSMPQRNSPSRSSQ